MIGRLLPKWLGQLHEVFSPRAIRVASRLPFEGDAAFRFHRSAAFPTFV